MARDESEPDWHRVVEEIVERTLADLETNAGGWWRFRDGRAFSNRNTAARAVQRVTIIAEPLIRDEILDAAARPLLRLSAALSYAGEDAQHLYRELAIPGVAFDYHHGRFFLEGAEGPEIAEASGLILSAARDWWKHDPAGVLAAVGREVETRRSSLGLEGWTTLGEVDPDVETLLVAFATVASYSQDARASPVDLRRLFGDDDLRAAEDPDWRRSQWRRLIASALDLAHRSTT